MNLDVLFGGKVAPRIRCGDRELLLDRPRVMGILNVTPDSFSDGGKFTQTDAALAHAESLIESGADVIDIGGESTRPGAVAVSPKEQIRRVVPVIEALAKRITIPISIDTSEPEVMRAAAGAGAGMLNDQMALRVDGAMAAAAELGLPVCLMHMQGTPATMQDAPHYLDVVDEVRRFLADRVLAAQFAGLDPKQLLVDPGFGFGKMLAHNVSLLANLRQLTGMGAGLMVGLSRKRMIGELTEQALDGRTSGSVAAALIAAQQGAILLRVHDVRETVDALKVLQALHGKRQPKKGAKPGPKSPWDDDDA
ncbi:dihydropteroate synthase [Ahniella affigens]|uniref:Dihydropteroate synthase n=1 Tax=Ahniella affigens TaxID=2021234 RepID=A0A2P1PUB4_9GAMM|nr:dihydropteroate synthase [Ahniella affigens]AVP98435.1 dihydropteroate synthase [Ahniella affigens]